ncbi:MAG: hypothetical protein DIU73_003670 [Actinomycetes bacterium]
MNTLLSAAAAAEEAHRELPIPPLAYGLLAFAGLIGLLFVAYAFRSIGTRH